jgi:hypothetical protein
VLASAPTSAYCQHDFPIQPRRCPPLRFIPRRHRCRYTSPGATTRLRQETAMGKGLDRKKDKKKAPMKTAEEKRAAKQQKKRSK